MVMVALMVVSGALTWTLAEYCLHRWVGHRRTGALQFTLDHRNHHRDGNVFAPLSRKLGVGATVMGGVFVGLVWPLGAIPAGWFCLGFGAGYGGYEWLHWSLHRYGPVTAYGRWARRHHLFHHFQDPHRNHGVSSPIWDLVFGTYVSVERIRVPPHQEIRWLPLSPSCASVETLGGEYVVLEPKNPGAD